MTSSPRPSAASTTRRATPWALKTMIRAGRHLVGLVDEHGALGAEVLDDGAVVDDLVADVDRRPVQLERPLDHRDGAGHARAEAARLGKDHPHAPPLVSVSLGATILLADCR